MINKIKIERLQSLISREITIIVQQKINNELLNTISINEVKLSNDLRYAKIYYSSFLTKNVDKLDMIFKKYKNKIRYKLANKIIISYCPVLNFIYDKSLDNINRIEKILKNVQK